MDEQRFEIGQSVKVVIGGRGGNIPSIGVVREVRPYRTLTHSQPGYIVEFGKESYWFRDSELSHAPVENAFHYGDKVTINPSAIFTNSPEDEMRILERIQQHQEVGVVHGAFHRYQNGDPVGYGAIPVTFDGHEFRFSSSELQLVSPFQRPAADLQANIRHLISVEYAYNNRPLDGLKLVYGDFSITKSPTPFVITGIERDGRYKDFDRTTYILHTPNKPEGIGGVFGWVMLNIENYDAWLLDAKAKSHA